MGLVAQKVGTVNLALYRMTLHIAGDDLVCGNALCILLMFIDCQIVHSTFKTAMKTIQFLLQFGPWSLEKQF